MDAAEYRQVVELVDAALDLEPALRGAFLDRECAAQPKLRSEVESLLAQDEAEDDRFLATPAAVEILRLVDVDEVSGDESAQLLPEFIGPYRILGELGRGGMGTVFLAEQREPIERRVALKVIYGFGADRGTRRFAAECRALARLKHPSIAAVYDAGVTDDHRAYVAMEWIEGDHITEWCDRNGLSVSERIELFLGVCAGVSHAHQKSLVHRDLKPSNVLVADVDGRPTAKVIDFGIAHTLGESVSVSSRPGLDAGGEPGSPGEIELSRSLLMGSPVYMSPEAARLEDRSDLDTRTDVFSLGILLYELLVGVPPFEVSGLGVGSVLEQVRNVDSPAPSQRWAQLEDDRRQVLASLRGSKSRLIERGLHGDLDAILAKATARDRDQRYGAVSEFSADLKRHLERRPVLARPPSLSYQMSRLARRHVGTVIAAAAVACVLVVGVVARTLEARRANLEADRARLALAEAEQLSEFLINLFEIVDPDRRADDPESVDELLAKAEARVDEELAEHPLARARLLQTFGRVAMNRRDLERASSLYEQALALREKHQPPGHPEIVRNVGSLGVIYRRQGRMDEAEAAAVKAIELIESSQEPDTGHYSATLSWLANLHYLQKRYEEAAAGHRKALEIRRREVPQNGGAIGESLNNLSLALRDLGRLTEAKPLLLEAESYFAEALGPEHPLTIGCRLNMAGIEEKLGRWNEAEGLLRNAASAWHEIHGPYHHRTLLARRALGSLWIRWWRVGEAVAHLEEMLEGQESQVDGDPQELARTRITLGKALRAAGDLDGAERRLLQGLEAYAELLSSDHDEIKQLRGHLALLTWRRGETAEAVGALETLIAGWEERLGDGHPTVAWWSQYLGRMRLDIGRFQEAESALGRALAIYESAAGDAPSMLVGLNLLWLGRLYREQGRDDEAAAAFERGLDILERVMPAGHPDLLAARAEVQATRI